MWKSRRTFCSKKAEDGPSVEEQADVVLQTLTFRARTTRSDVETGDYCVRIAEEAMEGKKEGGRLVE
jgi:hypothetical protein